MEIRKLPIGQGLAWFKQSIDLGGHNPRGVFGAAALVLLALYAGGLLFASAALVVLVGAAYLAWRDTFAGGAPATTVASPSGFEA